MYLCIYLYVIQNIYVYKVLSQESGLSPSKPASNGNNGSSTNRFKDVCPHTYCQRMPNRKG